MTIIRILKNYHINKQIRNIEADEIIRKYVNILWISIFNDQKAIANG